MTMENSSPIERSLDLAAELAPEAPRRRRGRRAAAAVAALLAIAAAVALLLPERDGPRYVTVVADRGDLDIIVSATGDLEPVNQVDVGTEVSGTIRTVAVDFNDRVERGQVLARLDTAELEALVLQGRANVKAARARVAQAEATLE